MPHAASESALRRAAKNAISSFRFVAASLLKDRCLMQASALSYATVLSIVPLLAVAFAVTKGLGMYDAPQVRQLLLGLSAGRTEVADSILQYIQNTNVQALGVIGTAFLLVTVVSLVGAIESAFNSVWKVPADREIGRRFINYVALVVICPVFFFAAFGATAGLQNVALVRWLLEFALLSRAYLLFLAFLPYLMLWMALFLLYRFLPNTRVRFSSAATSALLAGTLWQLTQRLYISYQAGATGYNAVYGSFAQIPLLFLWLYVSWLILLIGAEVGHALQCQRDIRDGEDATALSAADRRALGLALLAALAADADARKAPGTARELASRLGAPSAAVGEILDIFSHAALTAPTQGRDTEPAWLLAAPPDKVTVAEAMAALDAARPGGAPEPAFLARNTALATRLARLADPVAAARTTLRELADGE
ncbi:YihY/virulence factor BrkB family protein [Desulfovibrio sulfodismutans]|uniref:YihY/virulence factor BrkB family protein n=1 Tax=Desulfolutivibrio sulfodismutans TaxID=63561 RepID=A0A7K3NSS4_9BACT|nr:YihY/virulence factor BrkB family protein [Desulfolutivibrio sulfodismutans]NDY58873.1 YihY/virulence factor BrkB family protein [Desulfolutivibrio sulfodismutans]